MGINKTLSKEQVLKDRIYGLNQDNIKLQNRIKELEKALKLFMKFADDESMQDIIPVYENAKQALNRGGE